MRNPAVSARETSDNFSRAALLFDLLAGVVQRHDAQVAEVLRGERGTADMPVTRLAAALRAQGI